MQTYQAENAKNGDSLPGEFPILPVSEVDEVMNQANQAFNIYKTTSAHQRALFLKQIATEIEAFQDKLIDRAHLETGLRKERLRGERARTVKQLRLFAELIQKGDWVDARIDFGDQQPDLRKQLEPLGPVIVFGASNFPFAYSACGGDTAAALAAGCSVVVKAHAAHPGASQMVADAVIQAAEKTNMPKNVYQHVHDTGFEVGQALVQHKLTTAVGFTGSFSGGKALFDLAAERKQPVPVFAEMGSTNPVVLLPDELANNTTQWAKTIADSLTLDAGQFCTNPGILIALKSPALTDFVEKMAANLKEVDAHVMLHSGIAKSYHEGIKERQELDEVTFHYLADEQGERKDRVALASVDAHKFMTNDKLSEELFGPFTLLVKCEDQAELAKVIDHLHGQLTATIIATEADVEAFKNEIDQLKTKVGRFIFNGVPTGVEVCTAMQHGGPFPATTDSRFTAVGQDSIQRFVRPVAYQDWPNKLLPITLQNENPLKINRCVNGTLTKNPILEN